MLILGNKESGFQIEDQEAIQTLGNAFTVAIERRRQEQELIKSEQRYSTLFYDSPVSMILLDPEDLKVIDINRSARSFYGSKILKIVGQSFTQLAAMPIISDDNISEVLQKSKISPQILRQKKRL